MLTHPVWSKVVRQCGDLWPLFSDCRLDLSSKSAARVLGFSSAAEFSKHLRRQGLPPFRLLRDWAYVVLLVEHHGSGQALAAWALDRGADPAVYYRFIARVTGHKWSEVKGLGAEWAVQTALQVWAPFLSP